MMGILLFFVTSATSFCFFFGTAGIVNDIAASFASWAVIVEMIPLIWKDPLPSRITGLWFMLFILCWTICFKNYSQSPTLTVHISCNFSYPIKKSKWFNCVISHFEPKALPIWTAKAKGIDAMQHFWWVICIIFWTMLIYFVWDSTMFFISRGRYTGHVLNILIS